VDSIFRPDFQWYAEAKQAQLSREQADALARYCQELGIEFMASAFDLERLRWCEELGVKRHKIASRSVHDQVLLRAAVATGKDLIVSLGMWEGAAWPIIPTKGRVDFLYCVAKYPAPLEELHLGSVDFTRFAGFSDHSVGLDAALVAIARGAGIIEKHFTLDKTAHGPDHRCSMEPLELAELVKRARHFEAVL
jgi:N-acetylneuraminate synthase/N,N'-diacetyllegionaminate synthase